MVCTGGGHVGRWSKRKVFLELKLGAFRMKKGVLHFVVSGFGLSRSVAGAGLLLVLVVACVLGGDERGAAYAPKPTLPQAHAGNQELIALSFAASDKVQQVTVIDPRKQVMSVYHIDATNGAIELKSVRRIEWDLEMSQFNALDPLPQEIRSIIEQNR